jgi:hypothetical protein
MGVIYNKLTMPALFRHAMQSQFSFVGQSQQSFAWFDSDGINILKILKRFQMNKKMLRALKMSIT